MGLISWPLPFQKIFFLIIFLLLFFPEMPENSETNQSINHEIVTEPQGSLHFFANSVEDEKLMCGHASLCILRVLKKNNKKESDGV